MTPDIIIIGGGLLGWSTAYRLIRDGANVTVIDREDEGHATAAGAGIIAPGTSFKEPEAMFALSKAATTYYPRLVEELSADGESDTGYETTGALYIARDADEAALLPETLEIMRARRDRGMGNIGEVRMIDDQEARERFPPLARLPRAILVPDAARVNGRLIRGALRRASEKRGVRFIHGSASLVREGDRVTGVRVNGETLPVGTIVVAGGAWSATLCDELGIRLPVTPQRGQIMHLDLPGTDTSRWPIVLGYSSHYVLTFPTNRVVAGATRESDSGFDVRMTAGGIYEDLDQALGVAPGLASATIAEIRVGLRPFPADGMPILGRAPGYDNVYLATGHGPSGLTLGPVSGAAIADQIARRQPPFDLAPFSAARFQD
jgi:D-amino-acid dehydrogenase